MDMFVRNRSLEDKNVKAFRAVHRLLEKYGPPEPPEVAGYLLVPEALTVEEWLRKMEKSRKKREFIR